MLAQCSEYVLHVQEQKNSIASLKNSTDVSVRFSNYIYKPFRNKVCKLEFDSYPISPIAAKPRLPYFYHFTASFHMHQGTWGDVSEFQGGVIIGPVLVVIETPLIDWWL